MPKEIEKASKDDVLSEIFLKEEDTLQELAQLISTAKEYFKIEHETGTIIFNSEHELTNEEKIFLLLLGKYFAKEKGIIDSSSLVLAEIGKELAIKSTTLSAPLGRLVATGTIRKEGSDYKLVYHKVKPVLNEISAKGSKK